MKNTSYKLDELVWQMPLVLCLILAAKLQTQVSIEDELT